MATIGYVTAMLLVKIEEEEVGARVKFQDHLRGLQLQIGWEIVCLGEDWCAADRQERDRVELLLLVVAARADRSREQSHVDVVVTIEVQNDCV